MPTGPVVDLSDAADREGTGGKAAGLADLVAAGEAVLNVAAQPKPVVEAVRRVLLVPSLMHLLGDANWWTPRWLKTRAG